jgi:hypothetical protein
MSVLGHITPFATRSYNSDGHLGPMQYRQTFCGLSIRVPGFHRVFQEVRLGSFPAAVAVKFRVRADAANPVNGHHGNPRFRTDPVPARLGRREMSFDATEISGRRDRGTTAPPLDYIR